MFKFLQFWILILAAKFGSSVVEYKILPKDLSAGVVNQDIAYLVEAVHEHQDALYHKFYLDTRKILPQYNFHVSIERGNEAVCSGAIVKGGQHVVTAASCGVKDTDIVRIDSPKQTKTYDIKAVGITCVKNHPNFHNSAHRFDYDIAVIRLNETTNVKTLYLNASDYNPKTGEATHYSNLANWSFKNSLLVTSDVPIISPEDCRRKFGFHLTENMLCAGVNSSKVSFCSEDHGNPLFYKDTLIGVKSWGEQCSRFVLPAVYTDVSKLQSWILETIKSPNC